MYGVQEIRPEVSIRKFLLVESKSYKDVWLRPYEMHVDHGTVNMVQDVVMRSMNNSAVGAIRSLVNKDMPNILTPSGNVIGKANIINGWGEKRFKFVLIVEIRNPGSNTSVINYIQGFSEYLGISKSDNLDPNMRFYPNTVIKLRRTYDKTSGVMVTEPLETFNVVHDETGANNNTFNSLKLARPGDVAMSVSAVKDMDDVVSLSNVGSVGGVELVNKKSLLPGDHVAHTIMSAVNSKMSAGIIGSSGDVIDTMVGDLMDPSIYQIDFFKTILNIRGREDGFTINDLQFVDPSIQNKVDVIMGAIIPNMSIPNELMSENTADTYDASLETRLSIIVHEAVSTILNESILNSIVFEIDNYSGTPNGGILDASSYVEGLFLPAYTNVFLNNFIKRAWNAISNNNLTPVKLLVMGMAESDTTIVIETDGRHPVTYRYPTFADSKFLPIIMDNQRLDAMTEDYDGLIDASLEATGNVLRTSASNTMNNGGLVNQFGVPF